MEPFPHTAAFSGNLLIETERVDEAVGVLNQVSLK